MRERFTLYGWHLSYFTGKVRCYLRYKGIAFKDCAVDLLTLLYRVKKHTGVVVMPVLVTPEGEWWQDSSEIIDRLEARFPARTVIPVTPLQRFTCYLLEAWADEWWIPIAMHTRWSHAENYLLWDRDAGSALLPYFPRWLKSRAAAYTASAMRRHLPSVGVVPAQFALLDAWAEQMLDQLEVHFSAHEFLLGASPSLADFALAGPFYGHLARDPWPLRELIAPRPYVRAWIERMSNPLALPPPGFLPEDAIAATLLPVLRRVFAEFIPMLEAILVEVNAALPALPSGRALARGLGEIEFPMGHGRFRRAALPYSLWMAQRTLDVYRQMTATEQAGVRSWLQTVGGERLLALQIPRLRRVGLRVAPDVHQEGLPNQSIIG